MEIKINKEIRNYYEAVFLGLPLRAVLFSLAGIVLSLIVGFSLRGKIGSEGISWIITVIMVPCFLFGYKKMNGMYMEKYLAALIKSEFLTPKKLTLGEDNIYRKAGLAPVGPKPAEKQDFVSGFIKKLKQRISALKNKETPVQPAAACGKACDDKEEKDERQTEDI